MKKSVFSALVSVLILNLAIASHSKALNQNDLPRLEQQAQRFIAEAEIKQLLAKDIMQSGRIKEQVFPEQIEFGHTALDLFSDTDVCVTVDFRYGPLKGVLSLLFHWEGLIPRLIDHSYWLVRTEVSDDIFEDTIWTPKKSPYYVTRNMEIYDRVKLTIQPGTVVRFRKFTDPRERIRIHADNGDEGGTLLSQGTDANPVVFTTSCDFEDLDEIQSWSGDTSPIFRTP